MLLLGCEESNFACLSVSGYLCVNNTGTFLNIRGKYASSYNFNLALLSLKFNLAVLRDCLS